MDYFLTHTYLCVILLQQNHHTWVPHPRPHLQTVPTTTCQTVTYLTRRRWTSKIHHQFRRIPTWDTAIRRRLRLCPPTAPCCATRGAPCRPPTCSTTQTRIRRYCKHKHWLKNANWAVSGMVIVLTNRKDILCETRRTFCMCCKMCVCGVDLKRLH